MSRRSDSSLRTPRRRTVSSLAPSRLVTSPGLTWRAYRRTAGRTPASHPRGEHCHRPVSNTEPHHASQTRLHDRPGDTCWGITDLVQLSAVGAACPCSTHGTDIVSTTPPSLTSQWVSALSGFYAAFEIPAQSHHDSPTHSIPSRRQARGTRPRTSPCLVLELRRRRAGARRSPARGTSSTCLRPPCDALPPLVPCVTMQEAAGENRVSSRSWGTSRSTAGLNALCAS